MNSSIVFSRFAAALFAAVVFISPLFNAHAVVLEPGTVPFDVLIDGAKVGEGELAVDAEGAVSIAPGSDTRWEQSGDVFAQLNSFSGNIDPVVIFGVGATNNSALPHTYAFAFSLPVSIPEPIQASAEVSYSLTAGTAAGATLFPTSGTQKVVDSQDIRLSPFLSVDKQVDVGDPFTKVGFGTGNSPVFSAGPVVWGVVGGPTYDLMSVNVAFGLTGQSAAGVSGNVVQIPVPEPSTYGMLAAGLLVLGVIARRRLS
jgi:hypothetical protein